VAALSHGPPFGNPESLMRPIAGFVCFCTGVLEVSGTTAPHWTPAVPCEISLAANLGFALADGARDLAPKKRPVDDASAVLDRYRRGG